MGNDSFPGPSLRGPPSGREAVQVHLEIWLEGKVADVCLACECCVEA